MHVIKLKLIPAVRPSLDNSLNHQVSPVPATDAIKPHFSVLAFVGTTVVAQVVLTLIFVASGMGRLRVNRG